MTGHTHQTAPTQFVDGAGIRFAYRRFGKNQGVPLVFFQHFTGNMDNWDPAVTDGLARDREVILFNNAGISSSGGETPNTTAFGTSKMVKKRLSKPSFKEVLAKCQVRKIFNKN